MNRILVTLCALFALIALSEDAQACKRCGIFGRGCRYVNSYVAPVYKIQQPSVYVVQNNLPQPLAAQGQSIYGYNAAVQAYSVNPAEVLHQSSLLATAANQLALTGVNGFNSTAQLQLGLQAQLAEPLVKSNAAAQVLTAAGLNQQAFTAPQSFALKVTIGADGKPIVESMNAQEVNNRMTGRNIPVTPEGGLPQPGTQDPPPDPQAPANPNSILSLKCGSCHGTNLAAPKAGLFFDANTPLDCNQITKALRAIRDGKMPKGTTLTPEEKGQVMEELLANERQQ